MDENPHYIKFDMFISLLIYVFGVAYLLNYTFVCDKQCFDWASRIYGTYIIIHVFKTNIYMVMY